MVRIRIRIRIWIWIRIRIRISLGLGLGLVAVASAPSPLTMLQSTSRYALRPPRQERCDGGRLRRATRRGHLTVTVPRLPCTRYCRPCVTVRCTLRITDTIFVLYSLFPACISSVSIYTLDSHTSIRRQHTTTHASFYSPSAARRQRHVRALVRTLSRSSRVARLDRRCLRSS